VCRALRAWGKKGAVAVDSWSSGVGTMENIHAAFASPNVAILELVPLAGPLHTEIYADGYRFKDGYILPPDVPTQLQLKERSMFAARKVGLFFMALSLYVGCGEMIVEAVEDHRVEVKTDRRVTIVPPTKGFGRAQLGMVRHPDGTIFVNSQTLGLYKSSDNGKTWTASPVSFDSSVATGQKLHGLGVSSTGRLYLLHQRGGGGELFISTSTDEGQTWATVQIDWSNLNPSNPYDISDNDYNSFVELSDGTMMTAIELRYDAGGDYWDKYQMADQSIPGFHETMIRSSDNGATWGVPTSVNQYVAETSLVIDPKDSSHILAVTRMQRMLLPGEDRATVESLTGWPAGAAWVYKNGILLESNDNGNTFHEAAGGLLDAGHTRGTALWTANDTVVVAHTGGITPPPGVLRPDVRVLSRISLDGGRAWVDGTKTGTPLFNKSKEFELAPNPPGHSFTTPTVEISPNHFLTAYAYRDAKSENLMRVSGVFWHIEPAASK